jgi:Ser/Thr protein kinase RdoA (MazF antagonist)
VKLALDAAVAVARDVGLDVREPRLLRDLTNILVHLAPEPVVARVPMTFTRLRGRSWIERELELTAVLADAGAQVAGPARSVDPGPYERDGYLVTLWEYVDHDRERPLDARRAGEALREIHELLAAQDPRGLDHFARLDEIETLVAMLELSPDERHVFEEALSAAQSTVDGLDPTLQPIHGDAHRWNLLHTPAGLLWSDFENLCLGPRELDLACNEIRARTHVREREDDELLAGYGDFDAALVSLLIPVHALFLAAWTFELAERTPQVRPHAIERLGWVREGFGL